MKQNVVFKAIHNQGNNWESSFKAKDISSIKPRLLIEARDCSQFSEFGFNVGEVKRLVKGLNRWIEGTQRSKK